MHSIQLSEELFLGLDDLNNDGVDNNGGDGVNNCEEGTKLTNKDRMGEEDDVDSEDEMDDVGEEEGAVEVVSLVSCHLYMMDICHHCGDIRVWIWW